MDNSRKPKLRFKGFTDDWEQRKLLGTISFIIDYRGRTPKKLGYKWSENGILALSALNVKMGYIDKNIETHYGDNYLYDLWMKNTPLHKDQVLMTTEAPAGNIAQIPDNSRYILSQRAIAFEAKNDIICDNFLAKVLSSQNVQNQINDLSTGGTAKGVSQKTLAEVNISYPIKMDEQSKISKFISNIDNLITLHQRKCDKLVEIKKSLLEKMFPKNSSKIPEIRFKGFNDDWEQRKLGEEAIELIAGGDIDKSKSVDNGKYPIYANALTNEGIIGYYNNYYRVKAPAVTITGRGEIGHAIARNIDFTPVVRLLSLKTKHNNIFLANAINQLNAVSESTGVPQLTVPQVEKYELKFPKEISEENKIGKLFNNLDNLITLHQRKLENLKNIKKSLLEKMFV